MVLFFIELSTRRVQIVGISAIANGFWMNQVARNLTDAVDGLLKGKCYLIHDRDPLFTAEFLSTLAEIGTKSLKLPPRSPNLNSYAERFVRSIKESCLERMILFGEDVPVNRRSGVRFPPSPRAEPSGHRQYAWFFSELQFSWIALDRFPAAAAPAECSIIMIGPHDEPGIPVFGYYGERVPHRRHWLKLAELAGFLLAEAAQARRGLRRPKS